MWFFKTLTSLFSDITRPRRCERRCLSLVTRAVVSVLLELVAHKENKPAYLTSSGTVNEQFDRFHFIRERTILQQHMEHRVKDLLKARQTSSDLYLLVLGPGRLMPHTQHGQKKINEKNSNTKYAFEIPFFFITAMRSGRKTIKETLDILTSRRETFPIAFRA